MRTIETIQAVNQAVKNVQSSNLSTMKQNKVIKAVRNASYNGISCNIVGYNLRMNKKPLELATYLVKLEVSRSKPTKKEKLAFE